MKAGEFKVGNYGVSPVRRQVTDPYAAQVNGVHSANMEPYIHDADVLVGRPALSRANSNSQAKTNETMY